MKNPRSGSGALMLGGTLFRDGYFDIAIANLAPSVFRSPSRLASEAVRILKPGGLIIATEVSKSSILGRIGELFDAVTGRLYYTLYSPRGLVDHFTPFGMTVTTISRIPLIVRLIGHFLRIPSRLSPVFLASLSKPQAAYDGRRVN